MNHLCSFIFHPVGLHWSFILDQHICCYVFPICWHKTYFRPLFRCVGFTRNLDETPEVADSNQSFHMNNDSGY